MAAADQSFFAGQRLALRRCGSEELVGDAGAAVCESGVPYCFCAQSQHVATCADAGSAARSRTRPITSSFTPVQMALNQRNLHVY